MKKLLALLLAALMVFGLAACGGETAGNETTNAVETTEPAGADMSQTEDQTPDSITIEHAMGTTEVSYAPERVCVLDSNAMDFIQVVSNDDWEKDKEKLEAERSCRILFELGMVMYSNDAPEEVIAASTYERNTEPEAQSAKNQVIADWIAQVDPEYILIVDRNFTSVEEAEAEGCAYAELAGLKQYQAGKMFMLSYDGRIGASGLQGMMIQLNELAEIFLS